MTMRRRHSKQELKVVRDKIKIHIHAVLFDWPSVRVRTCVESKVILSNTSMGKQLPEPGVSICDVRVLSTVVLPRAG
jgi:hypothetical protein